MRLAAVGCPTCLTRLTCPTINYESTFDEVNKKNIGL